MNDEDKKRLLYGRGQRPMTVSEISKITVKGKPIGEYVNELTEKKFTDEVLTQYKYNVYEKITESREDFILERIVESNFGSAYKEEQKLSKERLRRALWLLAEEEEGRLVYTGDKEYDAITYLRESGWLRNHDKEIYEQGQRDGKPIGVGKWITKSKRNALEEWSWRECSLCGWCREDDSPANDTPFCPTCGMPMKEGD